MPLHQQVVGGARSALAILFGAVTLVLLIACANVANLMLSRATTRRQELAVRTALGAPRRRIVRQLMTESLLLAVAGAVVGLLMAFGLLGVLTALAPDVPRLAEVRLDGTVVGFGLTVALITGVLFGAIPAIRSSQPDLVVSLKEGGERGGSARHARARGALVVGEIALALVLAVGSGLLIRSFANVLDVGVGLETGGVLTAEVSLTRRAYPEEADRVRFFEELVQRVESTPGIAAASAITNLPLSGAATATSFWVNDRPIPRAGEFPVADIRWVHRDYHQTLGIPLIRGRTFDERDSRDAQLAVVVNEAAARELWPGGDPIGQRLSMVWRDTLDAEIIGVVGDVRHQGAEIEPRAKIYWHNLQWLERTYMSIVARTAGDPATYVPTLHEAVRSIDPAVSPLQRSNDGRLEWTRRCLLAGSRCSR